MYLQKEGLELREKNQNGEYDVYYLSFSTLHDRVYDHVHVDDDVNVYAVHSQHGVVLHGSINAILFGFWRLFQKKPEVRLLRLLLVVASVEL